MAKNETRILSAASELRATGAGSAMKVSGYAAKYNVLSHDLGNFREKIAPGAFDDTLRAGHDVVLTKNHQLNDLLARTKSGTLKISADNVGLHFDAQLDPNQSLHRDVHSAISRGDLGDCSFAFNCDDGDCDFAPGGKMEDGKTPCAIRTLYRVNLRDVAIVCQPAYPETSVNARAAAASAVSDQTAIKAQIAAFNEKHNIKARSKKILVDAARILKAASPLPAEEVSSRMRLGYSEDAINAVRVAAYGKQVRQGGGFEVQPMRYQSGSAEDPQVLLRGFFDDDDDDKDLLDDYDEKSLRAAHRDLVRFHRASASQSRSMHACGEHHRCGDMHQRVADMDQFSMEDSRAAFKASARMYPYTQTEPGK